MAEIRRKFVETHCMRLFCFIKRHARGCQSRGVGAGCVPAARCLANGKTVGKERGASADDDFSESCGEFSEFVVLRLKPFDLGSRIDQLDVGLDFARFGDGELVGE